MSRSAQFHKGKNPHSFLLEARLPSSNLSGFFPSRFSAATSNNFRFPISSIKMMKLLLSSYLRSQTELCLILMGFSTVFLALAVVIFLDTSSGKVIQVFAERIRL
jgi:hypothetical protein